MSVKENKKALKTKRNNFKRWKLSDKTNNQRIKKYDKRFKTE